MANGRTTSSTTRGGRVRAERRSRRLRRTWAGLGSLFLALPLVLVPTVPAAAADWQIVKSEVSTGPYQPGQNVQWAVTVSCSDPNANPCAPVTMTDPLPENLELVSAVIQSAGAGTSNPSVDADTDTDTVTFTADNVNNGQQAQVLITAQVPVDIPYSENGATYTNTATVASDNATQQQGSDDIDIVVPLVLDSETTKSIDPEGAVASPGTAATMTIGGTNTSNDAVDSLVITEPTPGTEPNPFTYLAFTGWGDVSWPEGATSADVTFTCTDGSTAAGSSSTPDTLPDPPADCVVEGFTVQFNGAIAIDASASIPFDVEQTDAVTEITEPTTITNTTSSNVIHGEEQTDPTDASDTYVITPPNNSVTPTKSFDPAVVSAGDPTTVTIGATNDGDPTTSLTITEPSPGTPSPFEGDDPLTFTGWGTADDPGVVQWPANADAASVTYTCSDGSPVTLEAEAVNTLPDPPAGCDVVGFSVEFTGDLVTGAEASIPFQADTDPDQAEDDVTHPNQITATIPNASGTADASLVTLTDRLATATTKSISPSTLPALPGQSVIVQLPTQLLPFGPGGSTTDANDVVVQDPTDPSDPEAFWDEFEPTSVRSTDVPAGATLTISYWDGSEWVTDPDCGTFTGATTVNCVLPDGAQGVQFAYHSDAGFPPGTSFQPNFTAAYTGPENADDPIANCGASSASSGSVAPTDPAEGCATVDLFPVPTDPGDLDFIAKDFLAPEGQTGQPYTVRARTQDEITAQITWSTNGFEGVDPMVISDIADPVAADDPAIEGSFYDAFDLVRVEAIDPSVDPLMVYDAVTGVDLFIDGAWVDAENDPCSVAAPCNTSFPGYTLTDDERANAASVRLTYTESPTREEFPADPTQPAAGSGVARSTQADGRHLDLTFRLRDDRRSGGPALGSTNGTVYNRGEDNPGLVNDTARGTATFQGTERTDTDDDDVLIIDTPINVGIVKDWTGGPLSVPPDGTPDDAYPSTHAVITATNSSVARVDTLRITEPSSANPDGVLDPVTDPGTSPFDAFTLTAVDITPPSGTETTTVVLTRWDGAATSTDTYDEAGAEGLSAADLADVTGIDVSFDGRVDSEATGTLDLTLLLREFDRYDTSARITVTDYSPVPNSAGAELVDPGGTTADVPQAWDTADMELQDAAISLVQTKSFDPATIVEPGSDAEENPTSTLTITGQPTGPSRAVEMVLTDVDGSFWNQYDLVGFDASVLTAPIDQVQVDACVGGTYDEASDAFADCTWNDGEPSASFALPDGVTDPSTVTGLRFTFTRADGAIWENPANPVQAVNLEIQVRDTLRSDPGTPVPSDLAQNDPAPGETAPGLATNDVTSTLTGADLVFNPDDPENPIPVSADADAQAVITYQHTENGVQIVKDFAGVPSGGTQEPNAVIPMNITVTNTGNRPIVDPVVVDDPMPTDPDGPQLRLADVDEPFGYALTEPEDRDPALPPPPGRPNGPQMPTDPDDVTVDQDGNLFGLTFTFPEGTVLEVGQVYTITVQVQFRVGLAANTVVNNTVGVTGDRPWDSCVSRLDDETGQCRADADVTPIPSAVLSESKYVKATADDELDVIVDPAAPNPPAECPPLGDDGFYAYPCTPVIAPGHNETWRIRVDNVGNLPIDTVVVYDRLPRPGDTASDPRSSSERGSQWEPILDPATPPQLVNAPQGSTTTFYYTLVDDYCADDLASPIDEPTCSDDPAAGGWAQLTADTSDETYAQITALKAVVEMDSDFPLQPGQFIALEGTTTTPAEVPDAGPRSIAWNSAAANGVGVTPSGTRFNMVSTEGTKVGVATAAGSLQVNKAVAGDAAEYAPDSFAMTVECTSAVGTWVETVLDPIPITVTPGTPTVVPDLPYGAVCTVTEDGSDGQTRLVLAPQTVTIDSEDPEAPVVIEAVNWYDWASLVIDKEVVTDAVDQDGDPVPFGPFEVTVDCTFLGEPVYAAGYGPDDPMVLTIEDGETVELDELPVGSQCTVTETGTGNASSVTITVDQGLPGHPVTTDGPATELGLVGDVGGLSTNDVTLTNTYDVGAIGLQKVVDGAGGPAYGQGPFTITVVCTYDDDGDGPGEPRTVYDSEVVLGGAGPLDAQIANLPTGAVCDVEEVDDAGATGSVVVPDSVTVGSGDVADVVVTNTFDVGSIQVDKELAGLGALYGPGPFELTLACVYQDAALTIPGGAARELDGGASVVYDGLPVGSVCSLTESDDFGASSTQITVDGGEPVDGTSVEGIVVPPADGGEPTTVTVAVENTFTRAPLVVRKVVDGDAAGFAPPMPDLPPLPEVPDGPVDPETLLELLEQLEEYLAAVPFDELPYAVTLECTTSQGAPVTFIPGGADRRFGPGFPALYFGLQEGDTCTVTETETGGATGVAYAPNPVVVTGTSSALDPVEAVVTNTYDAGSLEVEKVVAGDGADAFGAGPFTVSTACTFLGEPIEVPGGAERSISGGEVAVYDGLPVGAECVVTETATGGAASTTISASVEGGEPGAATIGPDPAQVTVTNTFDVGQVVVTKRLAGPGASQHRGDEFVVTLACTGDVDGVTTDVVVPGGAERTLSADDDWTAVYELVPQGAECTLAETDAGDAEAVTLVVAGTDVTVDPGDTTPTSDAFTVPTGDAAEVDATVTNAFRPTGEASLPPTGASVGALAVLAVLLVGTGALLADARRRGARDRGQI
jgi:large repetitive protein